MTAAELKTRKGTFKTNQDILDALDEKTKAAIFSKIFPERIFLDQERNGLLSIIATSPLFDPVEEGKVIPEYYVLISDSRGAFETISSEEFPVTVIVKRA